MTLVVAGLDALDPEIVDPSDHANLTLSSYKSIDTISSSAGEPSTHELWPTIITGLEPTDHGLTLDSGVAWSNPILRYGSSVGKYILPKSVRTRLGEIILNQTDVDTFRTPKTYYANEGISTIFDDRSAKPIGIPNYVVESEVEDREYMLRRNLGDLFERNDDKPGGHTSADIGEFYEQCMEMVMVRIARIRRALRSRSYDLVFGYTSGLDLIGHVSFENPEMQSRAYREVNSIIGELVSDLDNEDELLIVSDHGLQEGVHTNEAMVASTSPEMLEDIDSITDIREAIEDFLKDHSGGQEPEDFDMGNGGEKVQQHLEDLGYM